MCDVIKIRLKRRIAMRSGKGDHPLNIRKVVEWPILKLRLSILCGAYFILLHVVSLLFRRILRRHT